MSEADAPFDPVERLSLLPSYLQVRALQSLTDAQRRELKVRWWQWAHPGQRAPAGDWRVWLIRAGRGFGKTRAGAEWVSAVARARPGARIALVGSTIEDVRRVMIEGASGLLAVARPDEAVRWFAHMGEVHFPNGARAYAFSAEAPEKLRGPEHEAAWCDELGKWRPEKGDAAWDNLLMGMRGGDDPRVVVTTTPRPVKLMRRVMAMPDCHETRGRTRDNPHLPRSFVEAMLADYAGTRLTIGPHPMAMRRAELAMRGVLRAIDLPRTRNGRRIRVAGTVITRQRPGTAKGFVFLTLEDETGIANIIVRPDLFVRERFTILEEPFLLVDGILQNQEGVTSVKAERVQGLGGSSLNLDVESHDFY